MSGTNQIICIGTSTGGPRALQAVLTKMPQTIQAPIVIVQHMPPTFTKSLAKRLHSLSKLQVKEAEDGEVLENGTAYIAPGGKHMKVVSGGKKCKIQITEDPLVNGHRPAVDVLFESISKVKHVKKVAVIMTGMGADGTKGLELLKDSGNTIAIAEAKESCIVYGMPRAAIKTGKVDVVVPVDKIAESILKYIK